MKPQTVPSKPKKTGKKPDVLKGLISGQKKITYELGTKDTKCFFYKCLFP